MKHEWLAAVAATALMASGAWVQAQETPRKEEKPAAEKAEPRPAAAPKTESGDAPRAAETQQRPAPKEGAKAVQSEEKPGALMKSSAETATPKSMAEPTHGQEKKPVERAQNGAEKPGQRAGAQTGAADTQPEQTPRKSASQNRGQPKVIGKVQTSSEHATRVTEILTRQSRSVNVDIDVNVGVRVPESVTIYPLPEEVLAIAPEYQDDEYFITNDEVVFVAPDTHEIVGAIEYDGRAAAVDDSSQVAGARPCPVEN